MKTSLQNKNWNPSLFLKELLPENTAGQIPSQAHVKLAYFNLQETFLISKLPLQIHYTCNIDKDWWECVSS
jgi:hypothetical protein